jgi:ribosomal protein S18 acetylase RimI-like enzyme
MLGLSVRSLANESDQKTILDMLARRELFTDEELAVAGELLEDSLARPDGDYQTLCAVDKENAVRGYICFGRVPMTEGCYDLYWIASDPAAERQGIGEILLDRMEEFVQRQGGRKIYLDTSSTAAYKAARSFYLKHGFTLECVQADFYRPGDDKLIFVKDLKKSSDKIHP